MDETIAKQPRTYEAGFSVIMPTYNQCNFIRNAINSLFSQILTDWELIIINDGSTDNTEEVIADLRKSTKIKYVKNEKNLGLGASLNIGINEAKKEFIAYLPSDDFYYPEHLNIMRDKFENNPDSILFFSRANSEVINSFGGQYEKNIDHNGLFVKHGLQLVQVAHRRSPKRWVEREELVTADLGQMFWKRLLDDGEFTFVNKTTCDWSIHPLQRHRIINTHLGGSIHRYRQHYKVESALRFMSSNKIVNDENKRYEDFRKKRTPTKEHLKILIVGELSYNAERLYAFEEKGHQLYGLWSEDQASWTNTGPLPFGNITNLDNISWRSLIKEIKPDIIYALLNHGAVNLAHEVMMANLGIPFVWHFNEAPSVCLRNGYWDKLIHLYNNADGKIFINGEIRSWFENYLMPFDRDRTLILDGDQPKINYFKDNFSQKLSFFDGEIHTVVAGRMIGFDQPFLNKLAESHIHVHVYNESATKAHDQAAALNPDYFHKHTFCDPQDWTKEISKYDAGWMHCHISKNGGNIMRAGWDDFNLPCRIGTYAAGGIPAIQNENSGNIVASRNYLQEKGVGLFFHDIDDLIAKLKNDKLMSTLSGNMLKNRSEFSFDYNINKLIDFFKETILLFNQK